jgi:hypothetical protein
MAASCGDGDEAPNFITLLVESLEVGGIFAACVSLSAFSSANNQDTQFFSVC